MIRASRRRKSGLRGLQAIFTSQNDGRTTKILTGAAGIVAGLFLSILAVFRVEDPQALGAWANAIYSSLSFGSLGILLLICGGGTIIFAFRDNRTRQDSSKASRIDEHSEVDSSTDSKAPNRTLRMFGPASKMGAAAFIQSVALVVMYSGFVQEFESNLSMQTWIRSNFPVGQSVLNWEGVLILSIPWSVAASVSTWTVSLGIGEFCKATSRLGHLHLELFRRALSCVIVYEILLPQFLQNFASIGFVARQVGQSVESSNKPHLMQCFAPCRS